MLETATLQLADQIARVPQDDVPGGRSVVVGDVAKDLPARAHCLAAHDLGTAPEDGSDHPLEAA